MFLGSFAPFSPEPVAPKWRRVVVDGVEYDAHDVPENGLAKSARGVQPESTMPPDIIHEDERSSAPEGDCPTIAKIRELALLDDAALKARLSALSKRECKALAAILEDV